LTQITSASTASRLTKELIEQWFLTTAAETVTERAIEILEGKGVNEQSDSWKAGIAKIVNNYSTLYQKAAATVPGWQLGEMRSLESMIERIASADATAIALKRKLAAAIAVATATSEL
jgi:hypothetical protein